MEHFKESISNNDVDVFGYANHHSVMPGKSFKLFLSSSESASPMKGNIEIFRIGNYGKSDRNRVYKSKDILVFNQNVSITTNATGAAWKALDFDIATDGWESGYFAIDFIKYNGDRINDVAFIVVTDPERSGDILVKLSTNTYQAYNSWGGSSLYNSELGPRTSVVSFDRPTSTQFYLWEYYYVVWLEKFARIHDLKVGYATNYDLHANPDFAAEYNVLISLGHDEYWSNEEFNAYYNRIFKDGKNTIFLSANTAYWRIRYGDIHKSGEGRQLVCYKNHLGKENIVGMSNFDPIIYNAEGEVSRTGLFRGIIGLPETMLMGVGYESHFADKDLKFTYKVKNLIPWLFKGTNLKVGDELADVVGYEWDNTLLVDNGIPVWSEESAIIPKLERKELNIVFEGDVTDSNGKPGIAQAVYFETDAGAKVFSAGTIRWAWGVGKPGFVNDNFIKVNENLIREFTGRDR